MYKAAISRLVCPRRRFSYLLFSSRRVKLAVVDMSTGWLNFIIFETLALLSYTESIFTIEPLRGCICSNPEGFALLKAEVNDAMKSSRSVTFEIFDKKYARQNLKVNMHVDIKRYYVTVNLGG